MKKITALMLVLCMMLASIPVLAENDLSGTWYLIISDITGGTFELNADGTCTGTTAASGEEQKLTGTWTAEGNAVTLTIGDEPLVLNYDGKDLTISSEEVATAKDGDESGSILKFSREPGIVTMDEMNAYSTDGTIPEGKTKEDMETAQTKLGLLFLMAMDEAIVEAAYSGTWYLALAGVTCGTFELNADRTCTVTTTASGVEKKLSGTWEAEEEAVILTIDGQSQLLVFDGTDLVIYADADTASLASILKLSREAGVTADELNAYASAGTIPEGKTKEDMEKAQEQLGALIFAAALLN